MIGPRVHSWGCRFWAVGGLAHSMCRLFCLGWSTEQVLSALFHETEINPVQVHTRSSDTKACHQAESRANGIHPRGPVQEHQS